LLFVAYVCASLISAAREYLEISWRSEASDLGKAQLDKREAVSPGARPFFETIPPLDGVVSDTSCAARPLRVAGGDDGDVTSLGTVPLAPLRLDGLVVAAGNAAGSAGEAGGLPFDLTAHGDAQSAVAKDLLRRLEIDVRKYAAMVASEKPMDLKGLAEADILALAGTSTPAAAAAPASAAAQLAALEASFDVLEASLGRLATSDQAAAAKALGQAVDAANRLDFLDVEALAARADGPDRLRFALRRAARQYAPVDPSLLTRALMSGSAATDLARVNPFFSTAEVDGVLAALPATLLRLNRVAHARRAVAALGRLRDLVAKLAAHAAGCREASASAATPGGSADPLGDNLVKRTRQAAKALVGQLLAGRHYCDVEGGTLDPRFLVFEYGFDLLLRARQVEMVRSFVGAAHAGQSRVQQMIMGAGKTTVIGPLLTLLLADGEHLVTQVMPSALLDMSRNVLRRCFTCPLLPKRVYTLSFDRSVDDSADLVDALRHKLEAATRGRGVVVAAPEAIKSLVLKLVEQLHSIEGCDLDSLLPTGSGRMNRETVKLRDAMAARSSMADALVPVLDLWRNAVLVMDEVDVLLHPLRSELNFPIGHKVPIDLGAHRWNLPFFILDAVVAVDDDGRRAKGGAQPAYASAATALPTEAAALKAGAAAASSAAAAAAAAATTAAGGASGGSGAASLAAASIKGSGGLAVGVPVEDDGDDAQEEAVRAALDDLREALQHG